MANARRLKAAGVELTSPAAAWQGKVVRVDTTNAEDQRVYLEPGLPQPAEAAGRTIHFATQLPWDTSFEIRGAGKDWISTGGISLVCGLKSRTDARAGYTYLVNAGDEYTLPLTAAVDR
jgi:hypothetical protein